MIAKLVLWIVIIGGLGAGGYAVVKNNEEKKTAVNIESQTNVTANKPESQGKKMAFSAFLKNDLGAYKCTVEQNMVDVESTGTVYVEAGKIRGNFSTIAEGRTMDTSILIKDGYQYIWSNQMETGMKMKVEPGATGSAAAQANGTYSWSADQIGDYDCQPWKADTATFSLPSGKTFTDLSAMIKT